MTIKTKKGVLRTYIILSNPTQEWVYFSQSTQMNTGEVSEVLDQIDQSEGLLAYSEFYNTFHTIQDRKQSSDTFLGSLTYSPKKALKRPTFMYSKDSQGKKANKPVQV